ncbi:hypothetical protein SAMN06265367_103390 [Algoriphagus winogradskyi]|uniref:Uncharacterized protein n=1 Tax=Algoriphagus winogradskyi TaxID=237017 RepID=A0ABY1NYT6_9BACT|nr:hypothetical protein SAMN06265367_103390 [Algoriphagus winogradskyi]
MALRVPKLLVLWVIFSYTTLFQEGKIIKTKKSRPIEIGIFHCGVWGLLSNLYSWLIIANQVF